MQSKPWSQQQESEQVGKQQRRLDPLCQYTKSEPQTRFQTQQFPEIKPIY